jgi:HK97 family phage major capsid protein
MNAIKQLNEQRGQKLKDAQAIIETARGESRSLTPEEHNKVEGLHTEAENLTNTIAAEARQLALAGANVRQLSKSEERDVNSFDFAKIVNHLHRSAKGGVTTIDGIEAEMVQEGEREARAAGIQAGGIVLPRMLVRRENRDMTASGTTSTTGDQGGMTIATEKRGLLDDFFNASVLRGLGSTVLEGLVGNIDLPRLTAGTDPAKKAENASADEVSPTTAMLSLSPKRLPAYIDISERLLAQSSVAIEAILRNHLSTQMGAVREKSFWHGGGTNEPTGIAGTSGIGSVAGGAHPRS